MVIGNKSLNVIWKEYLKEKNLYKGDVSKNEADAELCHIMANLDTSLSKIIPAAKGMLYNNNCINASVHPEDFEEIAKVAKQYKTLQEKKEKAQKKLNHKTLSLLKIAFPPMDSMGPVDDYEQNPSATKSVINQDENNYSYHPYESNHQGVMVNEMPKNEDDSDGIQEEIAESKMTLDDRMLKLIDLMEDVEENDFTTMHNTI